jgi:polyphenol oxidase
MIEPDWPAPARVRALVTTRSMGDMAGPGRSSLHGIIPGEPAWLTQVHGIAISELDSSRRSLTADAAVSRKAGNVCVVGAADCMPVLLTDEAGSVVGPRMPGGGGCARA